jgi:hypothetical protein
MKVTVDDEGVVLAVEREADLEAEIMAQFPPPSTPVRPKTLSHRPLAPRVSLEVTPEIAAEAEKAGRRDSGSCMWAEAVKLAVPGAKFVSVDLQTIRFTDPVKPYRYTYLTPRVTQESLIRFDEGAHFTETLSAQLRGGQVTKSAKYRPNKLRKGESALPTGKKVEMKKRSHGPPDVIGGRTPPTAPLSNTRYKGRRRAFGLRGLVL